MLPLAGVRVLAVEQYGAGPFGSQFLADLGAEVIKIENPHDGGDVSRQVGPFYFDQDAGDSHFFQAFNRNKKSLTLNLKSEQGRSLFRELVATADAVTNNLRGDQPERLGLTYDDLKDVNPAIVCAHLSAYGRQGSRKTWPGYDYLMQAEAGYLSLTGEPDGPPARFGLSIVDMMTGLACAYGLVACLHGARRDGIGRDVDTSLFDVALHNLSYPGVWYLNEGYVQGREKRGAHPSLVPSQSYKTKDGWLLIMCNKEKFWPILCHAIGRPQWADDPRYARFAERLKRRDEITEMLDDALSARTTDEWVAELAGSVPVAPVYNVAEALENPFVAEQGRVADFTYPDGHAIRNLTGPVRVSEATPTRAAPAYGADTDALLEELGYSDSDIARLRSAGAI